MAVDALNWLLTVTLQTADKVTVETFPTSELAAEEEYMTALRSGAVAKSIFPGSSMQNDRLELPPLDKIAYQEQAIDEQVEI